MIDLRETQPADKEMIRHWRNSPDVSRLMYNDHTITSEEHDHWFRSITQDATKRYWIIRCRGGDVGLACLYGLDEKNRRCYWAFYLADPNMRGKAIGAFVEHAVLQYVFDRLGLNKLCCEVLATNRAVLALHEKFGFTREGYLREHVFKGGQFVDVVSLAITRSEWDLKRPLIEQKLRRIEEHSKPGRQRRPGSR